MGWHYAEAVRRHGASADEAALEESFRKVWRAQPSRAPSVLPREGDDKPWWKTVAVTVLRESTKLPVTFDEDAWFTDLYDHFAQPGVWQLYPDVLPTLERLQGRHRLAVISNFDGRLRRILANLEISSYFENLFISSEVGCEKPHQNIFHQALQSMEVSPSRALHVGDDPRFDQQGAEAAGLETFLLKRPEITLESLRP